MVKTWHRWQHSSWLMRGCLLILAALGILALVVLTVFIWYTNRPRPDDTQRMLFQGIEYIRDVRDDPRPLIIHVVRIDLNAPGLAFLVTPVELDDKQMFAATKTTHFHKTFGLQLTINGDSFNPWHYSPLFHYYPHAGDPVTTRGLSASQGDVYSRGYVSQRDYWTLFLSEDNEASFTEPDTIYNAVSGLALLITDGRENVRTPSSFSGAATSLHPRTAVGLDESGETLTLFIVDGRQPNYSEGATVKEMASLMAEYNAYNAINMDGGGSSILVIEDENGSADVLNSPIDQGIPGKERVIANHLGVYALPLE